MPPPNGCGEVLGPGFARIGEWASVIPASTAVPAPGGSAGAVSAPVGGRVCATGIRLLPRVTEELTGYDQARRTLTYQAQDLPAFVTLARNTWTVIPVGESRCRVTLEAQFQGRGALGALMGWAAVLQARRNARRVEADLGHYLRHGTPSPRKQRQLSRARGAL